MHVINDKCLGCRFTTCVDVCPVKDCFKIGANMLVIDPEICIDCGLCVAACPTDAISHDSEADEKWIAHNAKYSKIWDPINSSIDPLSEAEQMKNLENKDKIIDCEA